MYKLFTIAEANKLIPVVEQNLVALQDSIKELPEIRERLKGANPFTVETQNLIQESAFLAGQISTSKAQLDELGVQVKDVEVGKIDFPGQVGAEVVWLTWEKGQDAITHYQRVGDETALPVPAPDTGTSPGGLQV
jgi:hypothetical protein